MAKINWKDLNVSNLFNFFFHLIFAIPGKQQNVQSPFESKFIVTPKRTQIYKMVSKREFFNLELTKGITPGETDSGHIRPIGHKRLWNSSHNMETAEGE